MAAGSSTAPAVGESRGSACRRRAGIELTLAYLLIQAVLWTPRPWQARIYLVAAAFIAWATWYSWAGLEAMGWRRGNLLGSFWIIGAAAVVATVSVACAA